MGDIIDRAFIIIFWAFAIGTLAKSLLSEFGEIFQSTVGAVLASTIIVTLILYLMGCKMHEVFTGLD